MSAKGGEMRGVGHFLSRTGMRNGDAGWANGNLGGILEERGALTTVNH